MKPLLALVLTGVALLGAAGCGGDSADSSGSQAAATPTVDNAEALKDVKQAPPLPDRTGAAPAELVKRDVVVGTGPAVKTGDQLSMQYTGWVYDSGEQFDSSWERGEPFEFKIGGGQVIPGWDKGIIGMKAGGRRILTIPAKDAYGAQGSQSIPPNAALIFVVDLQKIG